MEGEMRDQLISDKAQVIQQELKAWVKENSILQPGERLAFSLRVEICPTVVNDVDNKLLELSVAEFFSKSRLHAYGVPEKSLARLINTIKNDCTEWQYGFRKHSGDVTVREFLAKNPDVAAMLRIPNFGIKSLQEFLKVVKVAGLPFDARPYA
jgi:hypothetical protein